MSIYFCYFGCGDGSQSYFSNLYKYVMGGCKEDRAMFFQWYEVEVQEAMGTNGNTGNFS